MSEIKTGLSSILEAQYEYMKETLPKHGLKGNTLSFKGFESTVKHLKKGQEYYLTLKFNVED